MTESNTTVSRRGALAGLTAGAATLAMPFVSTGARAQEVVLRAVTAFPRTLAFSQSFLGFVEQVNARGRGVVRIDYAGGPEVIPQMQQADAVRRGVIDMQYGPASFYLGRMPEADAWVGSTVTAMQARSNGGFALMQRVFTEKLGVSLLAHLDTGVEFYIYTTKEPKRTANGGVDLGGLKIRSQPIYRSFFEAMGVVPVSVAVPETYTGLERGMFDGAGWPIIGILDLSWDKFLRYRIDPGFFQTDLAVIVNPARLAGLPEAARKVLEDVAVEYEKTSYDNFQTQIKATDEKSRQGGMKVVTLSPEAARAYLDLAYDSAWKRMRDANASFYDELRKAYYTR